MSTPTEVDRQCIRCGKVTKQKVTPFIIYRRPAGQALVDLTGNNEPAEVPVDTGAKNFRCTVCGNSTTGALNNATGAGSNDELDMLARGTDWNQPITYPPVEQDINKFARLNAAHATQVAAQQAANKTQGKHVT